MKPDPAVRVLIVEDSQIVQAVLARNLATIPNVAVAGVSFTGRSGIAAIHKLRPDVVLLDLTMPDGNGFDVLTAIRGDDHQPLVIVLTFHSENPIRARCMELGAHVFIDKGGNAQALFDILTQLGVGELSLDHLKTNPRRE